LANKGWQRKPANSSLKRYRKDSIYKMQYNRLLLSVGDDAVHVILQPRGDGFFGGFL